jgi:Cu-Zn family superoxide dismutase
MSSQIAAYAVAVLLSTQGTGKAGDLRLEQVKEGLRVTGDLTFLPPGDHGFHIHEFGDCSDSGKAAGGHYNPKGKPHGHALKDPKKSHPGDMGNLAVTPQGKVSVNLTLAKLNLSDVAGRAIIIHEKADDFSQPLGNAGARIACGVIALTGKP